MSAAASPPPLPPPATDACDGPALSPMKRAGTPSPLPTVDQPHASAAPSPSAAACPKAAQHIDDVSRDERWDQRRTLRPPPYEGRLRRYLSGVHIGDDTFDVFSKRELIGLAHGGSPPQREEPVWVDWASVRRGQAHWKRLLGPTFVALNAALLQGFTIARFAEVLVIAGYTASATATWNRFRNTSWAILDWFHHPLDDPASQARKSIYQVRCMHAYARQVAVDAGLFSADEGEGTPLSQYDLAEVLMGFSAVCVSVLELEFNFNRLPRAQRADMYHCWRLIGHHLGILDEYNVCASVDELDACMDDYMSWTPTRLRTCRPSTHELQKAVCHAFGLNTGLGTRFFRAMVCDLERARHWNVRYSQITCLPGLDSLVGAWLGGMGSSPLYVRVMGARIKFMRDWWKRAPKQARRLEKLVAQPVSKYMDLVGWPVALAAYRSWLWLAWLLHSTTRRRVLLALCSLAVFKPFRGARLRAVRALTALAR